MRLRPPAVVQRDAAPNRESAHRAGKRAGRPIPTAEPSPKSSPRDALTDPVVQRLAHAMDRQIGSGCAAGLTGMAAEALLQRALANVLHNAVRYASAAGPISISARETVTWWRLRWRIAAPVCPSPNYRSSLRPSTGPKPRVPVKPGAWDSAWPSSKPV